MADTTPVMNASTSFETTGMNANMRPAISSATISVANVVMISAMITKAITVMAMAVAEIIEARVMAVLGNSPVVIASSCAGGLAPC